MCASSFYHTINTPTWITVTSKMLIDNILYNTFTKNILASNVATSISNYLIHCLPEKKRMTYKHIGTILNFLIDLKQINWSNYLNSNFFFPKPWLIKGILKSIKEKNKSEKGFWKSTDPLKKNELHIRFKTYRNSIVKLTP